MHDLGVKVTNAMGLLLGWNCQGIQELELLFETSTIPTLQISNHSKCPNQTYKIRYQIHIFLFQVWKFRFLYMWFFLIIIFKITRNIDIKQMDFVHFINKIPFWIDDKCSVKKFLLTFTRNCADCIHWILGAFRFNSLEGGRVGKILSIVDHILFCVGRVTDLS